MEKKITYIMFFSFLFLLCSLPVHAGWSKPYSVASNCGAKFPTIAIGSDDRPRIAYYNNNADIYYREKSDEGEGDWNFDEGVADDNLVPAYGCHLSLCLDNNNNPFISYLGDWSGCALYYAYRPSGWANDGWIALAGQDNNTSIVWHDYEIYIAYKNPATGLAYYDSMYGTNNIDVNYTDAGKGVSMATNGTDLIVSYYTQEDASPFYEAIKCKKHLLTDAGGTWNDYDAAPPVPFFGTTLGFITSLALDSEYGWPHIVYTDDSDNGSVMYVYHTGNGWSTPEPVASNVGYSRLVAIDVDKYNDPQIVFYDDVSNPRRIRYARKEPGQSVWKLDTIDEYVGDYSYPENNKCPSIKLDLSGNPHVAYHDVNSGGTLKYAYLQSGYFISGHVKDSHGNGISGVVMKLTGDDNDEINTTSTDESGYYDFYGLQQDWYYCVTPTDDNYTFAPPSLSIDPFVGDIDDWDFTAYSEEGVDERISNLNADDEIIVGNNKFDPGTGGRCRIMYNLSHDQSITIKVYDLTGNLVKTLVDTKPRTQGVNKSDTWDGTSLNDHVANGIYYIVVEGEDWKKAGKVAIVRGKN